MPFEESGKEIVMKFQSNYQKLKEFMERIDREIGNLSVFSQKEEVVDDSNINSKFKQITSVHQLKSLI